MNDQFQDEEKIVLNRQKSGKDILPLKIDGKSGEIAESFYSGFNIQGDRIPYNRGAAGEVAQSLDGRKVAVQSNGITLFTSKITAWQGNDNIVIRLDRAKQVLGGRNADATKIKQLFNGRKYEKFGNMVEKADLKDTKLQNVTTFEDAVKVLDLKSITLVPVNQLEPLNTSDKASNTGEVSKSGSGTFLGVLLGVTGLSGVAYWLSRR